MDVRRRRPKTFADLAQVQEPARPHPGRTVTTPAPNTNRPQLVVTSCSDGKARKPGHATAPSPVSDRRVPPPKPQLRCIEGQPIVPAPARRAPSPASRQQPAATTPPRAARTQSTPLPAAPRDRVAHSDHRSRPAAAARPMADPAAVGMHPLHAARRRRVHRSYALPHATPLSQPRLPRDQATRYHGHPRPQVPRSTGRV